MMSKSVNVVHWCNVCVMEGLRWNAVSSLVYSYGNAFIGAKFFIYTSDWITAINSTYAFTAGGGNLVLYTGKFGTEFDDWFSAIQSLLIWDIEKNKKNPIMLDIQTQSAAWETLNLTLHQSGTLINKHETSNLINCKGCTKGRNILQSIW